MSRLFGDPPVGAVTLVETPVSRWYARRARVGFFIAAGVSGVLAVAVLSTWVHPVVAVAVALPLAGVCGLLVAVLVRVWPVLRTLWHWAGEITLALTVLASVRWLGAVTHPLLALAVVTLLVAMAGLIRPVRRWLVALGWCAVVRHRLRLCFAEFLRSAARGRPAYVPLILLARPTLAGERVWVWLRPGLELADLEDKTGKLAVACWAGEVRVVRASRGFAALIRVDVTRRDPVADTVVSPLAALVPGSSPMRVPPSSLPLALDLPDIPDEAPAPARTVRHTDRR